MNIPRPRNLEDTGKCLSRSQADLVELRRGGEVERWGGGKMERWGGEAGVVYVVSINFLWMCSTVSLSRSDIHVGLFDIYGCRYRADISPAVHEVKVQHRWVLRIQQSGFVYIENVAGSAGKRLQTKGHQETLCSRWSQNVSEPVLSCLRMSQSQCSRVSEWSLQTRLESPQTVYNLLLRL